mmetsp:Transcript_29035/g.52142  ORF Transcript_29035/g.52142 Transcript_29035/m.52142 type:complete len:85 (+) Transcript_29035:1302-1556(+)
MPGPDVCEANLVLGSAALMMMGQEVTRGRRTPCNAGRSTQARRQFWFKNAAVLRNGCAAMDGELPAPHAKNYNLPKPSTNEDNC